MRLTLVPAYGRDYKSKKEVIADWEADKDFDTAGYGAGGYINRSQAAVNGVSEVNIRYKRKTQVCVIKLGKQAAQ